MAKEKDPAFLFYAKDFYEGTRTMLPEERACYVDLLIYQHQNGNIPKDTKRILMYCNGINEATLKATLQAKFKLCDSGWVNEKLSKVIQERLEFSEKQSINGSVGQFFKKAKAILSKKDYTLLHEVFEYQTNEQKYEVIKDIEINEATLQAMLIAKLQAKHKHLEDANEDVIANENINEVIGRTKEEKEAFFLSNNLPIQFCDIWFRWEDYKRDQLKFTFKSNASRLTAINYMIKISNNKTEVAEKIVSKSIANGWKGLFELQQNEMPKPIYKHKVI